MLTEVREPVFHDFGAAAADICARVSGLFIFNRHKRTAIQGKKNKSRTIKSRQQALWHQNGPWSIDWCRRKCYSVRIRLTSSIIMCIDCTAYENSSLLMSFDPEVAKNSGAESDFKC